MKQSIKLNSAVWDGVFGGLVIMPFAREQNNDPIKFHDVQRHLDALEMPVHKHIEITGSNTRKWYVSPLKPAPRRAGARSTGGEGGKSLALIIAVLSVFLIYAKAWGVF